ncbi:hypothetical protein F2P56_021890 [Juglans regia]|uniref:Peroxidase n=1 Tax=Juglans regia TaxID=51240 RepID=A0A833UJ33_JUGRE|nr:hypothetical protein F2P56_021890 [Juglans regia]
MIDDVKTKLEMAYLHTVSCADIVAIAARDVVTTMGGPYWNVLKGRKDGRVSKAVETINLPAPTFNVIQLIQSFAKRGLGVKDMVALSGAHNLGFSHCSSFEARLHNFSSVHGTDPSMNDEFAENLRKKCTKPNKDQNAGEFLDSTLSTFDNEYYKRIMARKGVLGSDQALFGDYRSRWIVEAFAKDQSLFFKEFAASMMKLENIGMIENDEVRLKCGVVNCERERQRERVRECPNLKPGLIWDLIRWKLIGVGKHKGGLYLLQQSGSSPNDLLYSQLLPVSSSNLAKQLFV